MCHQTYDDVYGMVGLHFRKTSRGGKKVASFKLKQLSKGKNSQKLVFKSKCETPFFGIQRLYEMQSGHLKSMCAVSNASDSDSKTSGNTVTVRQSVPALRYTALGCMRIAIALESNLGAERRQVHPMPFFALQRNMC